MNSRKTTEMLFIILLFILNAFLALPLIIVAMYNKRKYSYYLFIVFMGLLGFLWPPSGDLFRYQIKFELIKSIDSPYVGALSLDLFYNYLMFLFSKVQLDFAYLRFFLSMISYFLIFRVSLDVIQNNSSLSTSRSHQLAGFLLVFFVLGFGGIVTGVRFTLAFSVFIYSHHKIYCENKPVGFLFLALSTFIHFSFLLFFIVYITERLLGSYLNQFTYFILLLAALFLSTEIFVFLIKILPVPNEIKFHLNNYVTGHFALEEYEIRSLKFRISRFISHILIYPATIYVLLSRNRISQYSVFMILMIFIFMQWNMNSSFSRYSYIAISIFIIEFLRRYERQHKDFFKLLLSISFISYTSSVYVTKKELIHGRQRELALYPVPMLMSKTYDEYWIKSNVGDNGSFLELKD